MANDRGWWWRLLFKGRARAEERDGRPDETGLQTEDDTSAPPVDELHELSTDELARTVPPGTARSEDGAESAADPGAPGNGHATARAADPGASGSERSERGAQRAADPGGPGSERSGRGAQRAADPGGPENGHATAPTAQPAAPENGHATAPTAQPAAPENGHATAPTAATAADPAVDEMRELSPEELARIVPTANGGQATEPTADPGAPENGHATAPTAATAADPAVDEMRELSPEELRVIDPDQFPVSHARPTHQGPGDSEPLTDGPVMQTAPGPEPETSERPWFEEARDRFEKWNRTGPEVDTERFDRVMETGGGTGPDPVGALTPVESTGPELSAEGADGRSTTFDARDEPAKDGRAEAYESPSLLDRAKQQFQPDLDFDDDGTMDHVQDSDKDGLTDAEERWKLGTNPYSSDSDGDGIPDATEVEYGLDPTDADTDDDGLPDGFEFKNFDTDQISPTNPRSAGDGRSDAELDPDLDGRTNAEELADGTHPNKRDAAPATLTDTPDDEFFEKANVERRRLIAEMDARDAKLVEGEDASPDGIIRTADPDLSAKARYQAVDGRIGKDDFVWDTRTEEMAEGDKLERGSTLGYGDRYGASQATAKANEFGDEVVPLDSKGPPPGGEREPDGYEEGDGEPEYISSATDLSGKSPALPGQDRNPIGAEVDIDEVIESRLARGTADDGSQDGTRPKGGDSTFEDSPMGTGRIGGAFDGGFGQDDTLGDGSPRSGSDDSSGEAAKQDDGQQNEDGQKDEWDTTTEDDRDAGAKQTGSEGEDWETYEATEDGDVKEGSGRSYHRDEDGTWYDENGNPVNAQTAAELEEAHKREQEQQQQEQQRAQEDNEEEDSSDQSDGVSTSVDPEGAHGDRTKAEQLEDELGAPKGPPRAPIDPAEHETGVEGRDIRHLISSDDLAQPAPDQVAVSGGPVPTNDPGASSGRGGTGAIDYGPDHVTNETGPLIEENVPGAERGEGTYDDTDFGSGADELQEVELGTALTVEGMNEAPQYYAVATGPNDAPLRPTGQEDDAEASDPLEDPVDVPVVPEDDPFDMPDDKALALGIDELDDEPAVEIDHEFDKMDLLD